MGQPAKLLIEVNKLCKLLLFANPLEAAPPHPDDPNVLYFPSGVHEPGEVIAENGQTIYLAPGALVKGNIKAENMRT